MSHGHRTDEGATVVVSTWRPVADRYGEHGAAEVLTHARLDSLAGALHQAFPPGSDGNRAEEGYREAGRLDPRLAWATRIIGVYGRGAEPGEVAIPPSRSRPGAGPFRRTRLEAVCSLRPPAGGPIRRWWQGR